MSTDDFDPKIDYYEVLEVSPKARRTVIVAAYRRLVLEHDPNFGSAADHVDPSEFKDKDDRSKELHFAYEVLSDPIRRQRYDEERAESAPAPPPPYSDSGDPSVPLFEPAFLDFGHVNPGDHPPMCQRVGVYALGRPPTLISYPYGRAGRFWEARHHVPRDDDPDPDVVIWLDVTVAVPTDASDGPATDNLKVAFDGNLADLPLSIDIRQQSSPRRAGDATPSTSRGSASDPGSFPTRRVPTSLDGYSSSSRAGWYLAFAVIVVIVGGIVYSSAHGHQSQVGSPSTATTSSAPVLSAPTSSTAPTSTSAPSATWSGPNQVAPAAGFTAVSCPNSSFCVAVDQSGNAFIDNAGTWSTALQVNGNESLTSISCATNSFCMATTTAAKVYNYSGGMWTSTSLTGADGSPANLTSVSCPVAGSCVATGEEDAYRFADGAWSTGVVVDSSHANLISLSCPNSSFCVAVDQSGREFHG